jgi:hypothetical protein
VTGHGGGGSLAGGEAEARITGVGSAGRRPEADARGKGCRGRRRERKPTRGGKGREIGSKLDPNPLTHAYTNYIYTYTCNTCIYYI